MHHRAQPEATLRMNEDIGLKIAECDVRIPQYLDDSAEPRIIQFSQGP